MTTPDPPESGPRSWTLYASDIETAVDGPELVHGDQVHVVEYSALDHMANCFAAEQDRRLKAEDTILVNQGQIQSLRKQVTEAEARIADGEREIIGVWKVAHDWQRKCDAAEARVKELKDDIDGEDGWRDSCAFFEKRAEAAERERDAYKHAKSENDERFMLERDNAIARIVQLQVTCGDLTDRSDTLKAKLKEVDKDLHSAEVHVKELIADNERLRAALILIDEEIHPGAIARGALKTTMENK